ncbi:hypothetical protein [Legionella busanensis]|uniref:hypothetical protein n=1 Tax=Legionella busanensis TaxID=190655 RepID=UPI0013EFBE3E|nr:hypothetical protein [Legionella busanensis]
MDARLRGHDDAFTYCHIYKSFIPKSLLRLPIYHVLSCHTRVGGYPLITWRQVNKK